MKTEMIEAYNQRKEKYKKANMQYKEANLANFQRLYGMLVLMSDIGVLRDCEFIKESRNLNKIFEDKDSKLEF